MKFVSLYPGDIQLDKAWNSRKEYVDREIAEAPTEHLSTLQLEASVAEHGVLQPPMVRQCEEKTYTAVFGFRRIEAAYKVAPKKKIKCSILELTGDPIADDFKARMANLSENVHRESLKAWEIAEALYQIIQAHPQMTVVQIAQQTSLSKSYAGNLIRLRKKAHPDVWKQFQRWGTSMKIKYQEVLELVVLPQDRQLEVWNQKIADRKSKVGIRGKEKKPGQVKLNKYLHAVDALDRSSEFKKGLKLGLSIALGKKKWRFTDAIKGAS